MYIIKIGSRERMFFDVESLKSYVDGLDSWDMSEFIVYKIVRGRKKRVRLYELY